MAERNDLKVDQGSTFTESIIYKQADGTPVDLTGYGARMQVRVEFTSTDYVLSLTDSDGLTITPLDGQIDILVTAAQSEALDAGPYYYDLEIYAGVVVTRLIQGRFIVSAEVTR